ncbi:LysR family transcriptional regulator [Pontibacterium granulatum]|uniref:LysR family transcriptional regulator n=1 Tax=Pontibacterium granulatum TaxID=2036029 RepID=UPI00249C572E|nr:LysR family transcriptional regulator [Pontibacterium granulatum]MDI3324516.1 LysR family transcriptional regulator [Pontibacterium granulatum]
MPLSVQKIIGRMTFRQLQVFKAVYQLQSYSKAGELLGLTQPAVSSQIRQLEQSLDQPLFEYVGRRLFCTAAGERLAISINAIFTELGNLQSDLAALKGQVAGDLRLVAVNTAQYVVPYLLRAFLDLYPQISVSVKVVNRAAALQRLNDNNDDLVIMGLVPSDKPLTSLPFLNNELVPVVPAGHPLLQMPQVTAQEFLDSQLLLRETGSGSRLALEQHCQQHRLRLKPSMELGSNDVLKQSVVAGLGVGVLPKISILSELELGKLKTVPVEGFPLRRSWCVVYPQAKHPTPAMQAFLDYIQQNIKQFERGLIAS